MASSTLHPTSRSLSKALFTGKGKDQALAKVEPLKELCKTLNSHLSTNDFLVGSSLTHADISIFCGLILPMATILNKGYRDNVVPNLEKWFEKVS
jgi:glutathione S-transferase